MSKSTRSGFRTFSLSLSVCLSLSLYIYIYIYIYICFRLIKTFRNEQNGIEANTDTLNKKRITNDKVQCAVHNEPFFLCNDVLKINLTIKEKLSWFFKLMRLRSYLTLNLFDLANNRDTLSNHLINWLEIKWQLSKSWCGVFQLIFLLPG